MNPTSDYTAFVPERGHPFSIYLKLEEGTQADFEVVARSSLALISAIKDIVDFADPLIDVKVTIQNGEEGSLRLNTFIKMFSDRSADAKSRRRELLNWVMAGAAVFVLETTAGHYVEKFLNWIDDRVIEAIENGVDPEEANALAEECRQVIEGALRNDIASRHVRQFYEQLREDPNILGVGVSQNHEGIPSEIIPRSQFLERSKAVEPPQEDVKRERIERVTMLLVQPRLLGDEKQWRFSIGGQEFAAKVADKSFIENTLSGKNQIPLIEGVYLDVDLRLEEQKVGDVWKVKSRVVQLVHGVSGGSFQASLLGPIE